jgi:hypothetical protein
MGCMKAFDWKKRRRKDSFLPSLAKGRIFILGDGEFLKAVGGKALIIFLFFL